MIENIGIGLLLIVGFFIYGWPVWGAVFILGDGRLWGRDD